MSLTTGRGPLSRRPAGGSALPVPEGVVYVEPFHRRVRGRSTATARSSTASGCCWSTGPAQPPTYAFPADDVGVRAGRGRTGARRPRPRARAVGRGRRLVRGGRAGVRPPPQPVPPGRLRAHAGAGCGSRSPARRSSTPTPPSACTRRRSTRACTWRRDQVRTDLLVPATTTTYCPYKGTASYWSAVVDGIDRRRRRLVLRGPAARVAAAARPARLRPDPGRGPPGAPAHRRRRRVGPCGRSCRSRRQIRPRGSPLRSAHAAVLVRRPAPVVHPEAFVAPTATLVGEVTDRGRAPRSGTAP